MPRLSTSGPAAALPPSHTLRAGEQAAALRAAGVDVIDFSSSRPEDPAPPFLRAALRQAGDEGVNFLTATAGLPALRAALARKLAKEHGISAEADGEILVTVGAKHAVALALQSLLAPGDGVILLDPCWVSYEPCVRLAGGVPARVGLRRLADGRSVLDPADLRAAMTTATRLLLLNTPHNPTGAVFDEPTLRAVARCAEAVDAWILVDESFEKIVYPPATHLSVAALPEGRGRTLTVQSFSKGYVMPGLRVGALIGPRPVIEQATLIQGHTVTCAPSQGQRAALAALELPEEFFADMREAYRRKRDLVVNELNRTPKVRCDLPEGAFYAFPDCSALHPSSVALAEHLLTEAAVATVPGVAFGERGEGHLRLTFTRSLEEIGRGLERIRKALG
jgi:aspartate aminotransferase